MIKYKDIESEDIKICDGWFKTDCPNPANLVIYNPAISNMEIKLCKGCCFKLARIIYRRFNNSLEEFLRVLLTRDKHKGEK